MRPLYIFDLDGTLALIEHRLHFVERPACALCGIKMSCDHDLPIVRQTLIAASDSRMRVGARPGFTPDWRRFFAACVDDAPNWPVIRTLQRLRRSGAECWIWSGRSDEVKDQTARWLRRNSCISLSAGWWLSAPEPVLMRPAGDRTPDHELKAGWLAAMEQADRDRLVAAFDGRSLVVRMWRKAGVACFQVAEGNF